MISQDAARLAGDLLAGVAVPEHEDLLYLDGFDIRHSQYERDVEEALCWLEDSCQVFPVLRLTGGVYSWVVPGNRGRRP